MHVELMSDKVTSPDYSVKIEKSLKSICTNSRQQSKIYI